MKDVRKRSSSPCQLVDNKRTKQEYDWDQEEIPFSVTKCRRSPSYDPDLLTFGDDPNHGTEFRNVPYLAHSSAVNAIIVQTTRELSAVGKRLIQVPQLLDNGIVFEWILDATVKEESDEPLLAVSNVNWMAQTAVLQQTNAAERRAGEDPAATVTGLSSDRESGVEDNAAAMQLDASAAHTILIGADEGGSAGLGGREQSSTKNVTGVSHAPPSSSVQSVESATRQSPARIGVFVVHEPEAGPSQPRNFVSEPYEENEVHPHGDTKHGQLAISSGAQRQVELVANRQPRLGARRAALPNPGPLVDPYPPFKGFSSDSDEDSSPVEENVHATSITRPVVIAPDQAEGVRTVDLRTELDNGRGARIARDGGADRSLCELNSSRTNRPVGVRAQSSAKGAQSSPSLQRRGDTGSSTSRQSFQPPDRSTNRRPAAQAARKPQVSNAEESSSSNSSEESDDWRRPTHAPRRRAPAPQRSSPVARPGLFGDNAQIRRHEVNIPKAEFSRARRLLAPIDREIPYTTIAMRGDASFIDKQRLRRVSAFSLPFYQPDKAPAALVADACLVQENKAIVGFMHGPCQASLLSLGDQPHRIDLAHRAHNTVQESPQLGTSRPNSGISTLAPLDGPQLRFLSGGFDTTIHLWTLRRTDDGYIAHSKRLGVHQLQGVQGLAYRGVDNTLLSCGGSSIYSTDISSCQQPQPVKVSDGRLLQIHIHPQNPQVVVLEADQIENQVLVYDTRKGGFRHRPALQFGYRSDPNAENSTRFIKGSTLNSFFARPYNESDKGSVHVWDYRKATAVVACFKEEHSAPVVHAVLSGSDLLAYGGTSVTIWKTRTTQ